MAKPAIIIVGADKGGVGKTTVARTLLDYFRAHQVDTRAFDSEVPRGTLKRFHSERTNVLDMTRVADQMKVFDNLNSSNPAVTVVDVRAGLLSPILKVMRDIGLLEAAKNEQITLALFHILGPSIASLDEISGAAGYLGNARYFMVKNFINNTYFFQWDESTYSYYFRQIEDAVEIVIPKLNEMANEQVDLAAVPYLTFVANRKPNGEQASYSPVLRGYVRNWLGKVWAEYDRIGLMEIVAEGSGGSAREARRKAASEVAASTDQRSSDARAQPQGATETHPFGL